jgi:hypothetical protein
LALLIYFSFEVIEFSCSIEAEILDIPFSLAELYRFAEE